MKMIEFFGLKVKPRITKGKHMFQPLETGKISDGLFAIRDKDGNCFLQKTEHGYLAIDSGYKNSKNVREGLKMLGILPEQVHTVFLTHLDIDHAGGMDLDAGEIFSKAKIYLSKPENDYLLGKIFRKEIGPIHCQLPIRLREERELLADHQLVECDGVEVEAIYAPGHSAGHTAFRIGTDLFAGDCVIFNGKEGWCFYDFWNWNTEVNVKTLEMLDEYCKDKEIERVITSHSGILKPDVAFLNKKISPNWKEKGFSFIEGAEDDLYK